MSTESSLSVLLVTRYFEASPDAVFDAWLNARQAGKWLFATPSGEMVRVEIDARPGGSFVFVDRRDGENIEHAGEYVEIDRPQQSTRVSIYMVPEGTGSRLALTHENVLPDYASRTEAGWTGILDKLAANIA